MFHFVTTREQLTAVRCSIVFGGGVIRLRLGRRLVALLPVAQRTKTLISRPTIKSLLREKRISSRQESGKILVDPQKLEPRVGGTSTRISGPFQGRGVLKGLGWVGDWLTSYQ